MAGKNNIVITSIQQKKWVEYFEGLLVESREKLLIENECVELIRKLNLFIEKVKEAVSQIKLKKSKGPELIKYSPPKLLEMLQRLFERCLNDKEVSEEWKQSYISPIHKKGRKFDSRNKHMDKFIFKLNIMGF